MKKFFFCISLALSGLMTACIEKDEAVDADKKPSWLGGSIYQELKNPQYLTGTFSTYLRLVDDLGYTDVLDRTGSKTVFPANDEAFSRFFQSNDWGVRSYDGLSDAQKKMLLYSSMLDNALLVNMLSNVSNSSTSVVKGMALKHETQLSVTDTIQLISNGGELPQNNAYWDQYRDGGLYLVSDATRPMLVHFTREHMLNNGITTSGDQSDFAILTGTPYEDGMAYIFNDRIIQSDITCQNGYLHQMQDVIVPPGNMAQVLRRDSETAYFSHLLDYFCAPYPNTAVTNLYNASALDRGLPTIDMVYERRYVNNQSGHRLNADPNNNLVTKGLLNYDPGWNQYSPMQESDGVDYTIADIAAMFVPTDQAFIDFFTQGGDGAYLIDLYGKYTGAENTAAHLFENLDSLHAQRPTILTSFVNNLMKPSFIATVPSKFETIQNDANEYMGVSTDILDRRSDNTYDITIANNGVIYKLTEFIAPDEFQSVMAPSSVYPDMTIMNWAVQDNEKQLGQHHFYLMAMKQNFAFFIPDDEAFGEYYVDPVYLGHNEPRALKFVYVPGDAEPVKAVAYRYNASTGEVGNVLNNGAYVARSEWLNLFIDILNYHTVVLEEGETFGTNHYYKTKHGGEVYIDRSAVGGQVKSGQQIDNGVAPSTIEDVYHEKNGQAFRIDHIIQAPRNSVSKTLQNHSAQFSEFYNLCSSFSDTKLMTWAGISAEPDPDFKTSEQDAYLVFTTKQGGSGVEGSCLDENVKMFNTYNYTLYAPNNQAMEKAYAAGLPRLSEIEDTYERYADEVDSVGRPNTPASIAASADVKRKIDLLHNFVLYHFQSNSVYADNVVASNRYNSLSIDNLGLTIEIGVSGGNGQLQLTDATGRVVTVDANNGSRLANLMARDYWFDRQRTQASKVETSSFCVIHEIDTPLNSGQLGLTW